MNARKWIVLAAALAFAGLGWVWLEYGHVAAGQTATEDAAASSEEAPVATVATAPIRKGVLRETLRAYGVVVAAPGETDAFSVPFECKVKAIRITEGEVIAADTPLVDIEPGPNARLQLAEARAEVESAETDLKEVQKKFNLKLITQQDLLDARRRVDLANFHVKDLEDRGIETVRVVKGKTAGVVSRIDVQPGQTVAADTPLVEAVDENGIAVRVGIENKDVKSVKVGDPVSLTPLGTADGSPLEGHIRLITRLVNPETRLVNVFVQPPAGARLLLNDSVKATLVAASGEGLIVPRSAVIPGEEGMRLFTVADGKAVDHPIDVGIENAAALQITGKGLKEGDMVVVKGNSALSDGMAVRVEGGR